MRDRLIELLKETFEYTRGTCIDFDEAAEINADNLLENGVVVIDTDVVSPPNRPLISQYMGRPIDEVINLIRRNEWISVDERLPEDDLSEEHNKKTIKVLVAIKGKNGITIRTQERFRDYTYSNVGDPITFWTWRFSHGKVTHWMPLPEPPKMRKEGEGK